MNRNIKKTIFNITNKNLSAIDTELSSINSLTISDKVKDMSDKIKTCTDTDKIKIANFLCNKIHGYYMLKEEVIKNVHTELKNVIFKVDGVCIPLKLQYLRFKNETFSFNLSLDLYQNGVKDMMDYNDYFQILRYILKSYKIDETLKNDIFTEFETIFASPIVSLYVKMSIADIYIHNSRVQRGHEMLEIIRGEERRLQEINERNAGYVTHDPVKKTVYNDSQNVHDSHINRSVLTVAINLIMKEEKTEFDEEKVLEELLKIDPDGQEIFEKVFTRIVTDETQFKLGDNMFNMYVLFANIWSFCKKHKEFEELKKRMIEEFISMYQYCATGFCSRIVNIIQGFTDDPLLCITISDKDQLKSVLLTFLNKEMEKASDKVLDSMIETDNIIFLEYVKDIMNNPKQNGKNKIEEIIKEYSTNDASTGDKEINGNIISIISDYTNYKEWKIENKEGKLQLML